MEKGLHKILLKLSFSAFALIRVFQLSDIALFKQSTNIYQCMPTVHLISAFCSLFRA